jgi:hypothetical protein
MRENKIGLGSLFSKEGREKSKEKLRVTLKELKDRPIIKRLEIKASAVFNGRSELQEIQARRMQKDIQEQLTRDERDKKRDKILAEQQREISPYLFSADQERALVLLPQVESLIYPGHFSQLQAVLGSFYENNRSYKSKLSEVLHFIKESGSNDTLLKFPDELKILFDIEADPKFDLSLSRVTINDDETQELIEADKGRLSNRELSRELIKFENEEIIKAMDFADGRRSDLGYSELNTRYQDFESILLSLMDSVRTKLSNGGSNSLGLKFHFIIKDKHLHIVFSQPESKGKPPEEEIQQIIDKIIEENKLKIQDMNGWHDRITE